jgi:putative ABC transport system permease protein
MQFAALAVKNLFRRKMRTLFTLLGISSAVAAFIALVGMSRGLENAWMHALLERETHLFAVPRGVVDILSSSIDEDVVAAMSRVEGVAAASGELADMVDLNSGEMIVVAGWPINSYLWESVELEAGSIPGASNPNGVVLGKEAAKTLGLKIGDRFAIRTMQFNLSGISTSAGVMRNHAMLMNLRSLQELNNRFGKVSTINFKLKDSTDAVKTAATIARLRHQFPDFVFTEAVALAKNNKILALFHAMAWATSTIALFIGLVVVMNTLLMSVMERTREFGLLAAVGWSERRILSLVLLEGLLLAAAGGLLGCLGGIAGLYAIADSPHMQGLIEPDVSGWLFLEVTVATLVLGCAGSLYPAWRAIRQRPAEALRYD